MILLLVPVAAWAVDDLAEADRGACVYSTSAAHGATPDADAPSGHAAPRKQTKPATTPGGGSDGDVLLPRMRMPKWHSFLPGMFR